jgi:hypothetical protein
LEEDVVDVGDVVFDVVVDVVDVSDVVSFDANATSWLTRELDRA